MGAGLRSLDDVQFLPSKAMALIDKRDPVGLPRGSTWPLVAWVLWGSDADRIRTACPTRMREGRGEAPLPHHAGRPDAVEDHPTLEYSTWVPSISAASFLSEASTTDLSTPRLESVSTRDFWTLTAFSVSPVAASASARSSVTLR